MTTLSLPTTAVGRIFLRYRGALVPVAVVLLLGVLLFPLPAAVMSFLLLVNITLSILIMLTTVYVKEPLEFAVFPSVLLVTTLFRLVLNVGSTRLILSRAYDLKLDAAGSVIKAFGSFVAGDSALIGLVIFAILVVIQFVVITKGATRISEVAARFTLDGMPGKQMSIDADLNAGLIDEVEARRRRQAITREADFYGAMDGASKFVRGDAIAGIIITLINIVGGFILGLTHGMGLGEAAGVYTRLTIGDGLVTQIPAFVMSISAALLVTRATSISNLGEDVLNQVFSKPMALFISAGFLILMVIAGLPTIPLLMLAGGCAGIAYVIEGSRAEAVKAKDLEKKPVRTEPEAVPAVHGVDPLEIEVGYGLIRMVDRAQGGDLRERVQAIRRQLAEELGLVIPPIRIRDNTIKLGGNDYIIKVKGVPIAQGQAYPDHYLAMDSGLASGKLQGVETKGAGLRPPCHVGYRRRAHSRREHGLHCRRRRLRRRHASHRDHQGPRRRDTDAAEGPGDAQRSQAVEPRARRRARPGDPEGGRRAEGPPEPPSRARVGPRLRDHPRDARATTRRAPRTRRSSPSTRATPSAAGLPASTRKAAGFTSSRSPRSSRTASTPPSSTPTAART